MKNIQQYLQGKLKSFSPTERVIRDMFIESVESVCEVQLRPYEVKVARQTIFITTNPIVKSEVMINKGEILRRCKEKLLGKETIRDIR